ncbi:hypothetical protein GJ698_22085 [Pseudoduganella sp. FT26W]|uniref:Uncharacterized protein n=1 Tax=Duganella aquatilis TaxID=2666082 RepID=A0A844DFF8_9BURK|nr:hypothetical protein [Duganella aquatilis]MRW86764.1 hypothetical protein [Duganella aquatilis]
MTLIAYLVDNVSNHDVRKALIMCLPYGSVLCVPIAAWAIWRTKAIWDDFVHSSTEKVLNKRTLPIDKNANLILSDPNASEEAKREAAALQNNARLENLRVASKSHSSAVTDVSALQANEQANTPAARISD